MKFAKRVDPAVYLALDVEQFHNIYILFSIRCEERADQNFEQFFEIFFLLAVMLIGLLLASSGFCCEC